MAVRRIVRGRSATLEHTFYSGVTATDPTPDVATVTITRADGTAVVTSAATTEAGTGDVTYTVTPTQTALLDRWTMTWTATFGGQAQTFSEVVEVAGDVLFNLTDLQPLFPTASLPELNRMRTLAEQRLEKACGQAFVPRYSLETFDGTGSTDLQLGWPNVRSVRSAVIGGTAVTLSTIAVGRYRLNLSSGWTAGYGNVVVGYEHGRDTADEDVRYAALLVAQETLSGTEGRVVRREADGQAVTYASPSSGPFVDPVLRAIVRDNDLNIGIA
jgi:hypothetical protein